MAKYNLPIIISPLQTGCLYQANTKCFECLQQRPEAVAVLQLCPKVDQQVLCVTAKFAPSLLHRTQKSLPVYVVTICVYSMQVADSLVAPAPVV